jgi:hypothetical protein
MSAASRLLLMLMFALAVMPSEAQQGGAPSRLDIGPRCKRQDLRRLLGALTARLPRAGLKACTTTVVGLALHGRRHRSRLSMANTGGTPAGEKPNTAP